MQIQKLENVKNFPIRKNRIDFKIQKKENMKTLDDDDTHEEPVLVL